MPEAKYSQTQIADGHRMTREMDEALRGDGVWQEAGGLHAVDRLNGGKVNEKYKQILLNLNDWDFHFWVAFSLNLYTHLAV